MQNSMTHLRPLRPGYLRWIALCIMLSVPCLATVTADEIKGESDENKIKREIFVPFDDLDVLLDRNSNRVMLKRDEYERLLETARTREITRAPLDSVIVAAHYEGSVLGGITTITGKLIVEPLNKGLVAVPLALSGVALRNAQLDNEPAKLWRDDKGQIVLLVSGKGRRILTLQMTVPMQTTAARQSMAIQLPAPGASEFSLTVPGNVEVKSGLPVAKRVFEQDRNVTRFDLLIGHEPISLVMSLNNRLLKDEQVVVARSVLIHKLTIHEQQMHITSSLDVIHGAVEQVRFRIPDGYLVSQVTTELLSQWEIVQGDDGEVLNVQLRQPVRDDVVLSIVATRSGNHVENWLAPRFQPLDVAGHAAVVGILADVNLQTKNIDSDGVIPIDHEFLAAAIPDSTLAVGFSNPVSIVAAWYVPQTDYSIEAKLVAPEPRFVVKSNSRLVIDDSHLELQGGISLLSAYDSRFGFDIELPTHWRFMEFSGADGKPIAFERSSTAGGTRGHVRLPQRISSTEPTRVYFKARSTPADWLDKWQENDIAFPGMTISDATSHTGSVAVSINSDIRVKPTEIDALETLDDQDKQEFDLINDNTPFAFRFKSNDFKLTMKLERLKPSINARTYTFYTIEPTELAVHSELVFDVRHAKTDLFRFQLPKSSPASISIQGIDNRLKDFFSTEKETTREWTAQLSTARGGTVKLLVDYQQPLDEKQLMELVMAPIAVDDVLFQSAMLAVEGSTELDIELQTEGRAVDIGVLSEAAYQPGRYMLGAFSWPSEYGTVTAKTTRRPIYQLPSAIVQRAEMVTSVSTNGQAQTAARFQLVTKRPFLQIQLPAGSSLWSLQLDGKAAKPLVDGNTLLVSLFGNESATMRDLQLVYEAHVDSIGLIGNIATEAPSLSLHEAADNPGLSVPLVDLQWRVVLPAGYQISHVGEDFQSDQLGARPSLIERGASWLYSVGGGIGRDSSFVTANYARPTNGIEARSDMMLPDSADFIIRGSEMTEQKNVEENGQYDNERDPFGSDDDGKESDNPFKTPQDQAGDAPPTPQDPPAAARKREEDTARQWALGGLRSLNIELTETGNTTDFYSLGEQPQLQATVVNGTKVKWLAVVIALLIGFFGILLTRRSASIKILFVIGILLIVCLMPMTGSIFDAFRPIADYALFSVLLVSLYFVVAAALNRLGTSANLIAVRLPVILIAIVFGFAFSQPAHAQKIVDDTDQLRSLIDRLHHTSPVKLPADAIIIPFDAADPDGRANSERLLLPYEHYIELISQAEDKILGDGEPSPVDYVLSSAEYSTKLTRDEDLTVLGKIVIELLTDKPISVALPLAGGALADARVNGQPAKLQFVPATQSKLDKQSRAAPSSVVLLHLEGRGQKTLEFTARLGLKRQGGWRSINARLPVGLTRAINLTSLNEETEIRLSSDSDQRAIEAKPGEEIESVLSSDGSLQMQWKPSTAEQVIDQSLTAESEAVFDIREDGLRLAWRVALDFRGAERESFTLDVPAGFLVERVSGENIRDWDVKENADTQQLDVTLLSAARNSESFMVELSKRDFTVNEQTAEVETPWLSVSGAALDRGVLTIRRSPIIELKTLETKAARRIDLDPAKCVIDVAAIDAASSPLGITTWQSLRFVDTPFTIRLGANLLSQSIKAETQTVLRVGQSEADYEIRINYHVGPRPIYELSFDLPLNVEIDRVTAGQNEAWSIEKLDERQRVHLFSPQGIQGDFSVFVDGALPDYDGGPRWDIPAISINEADSQNGQIAVQVDPALEVSTENLRNCEAVLLRQLNGWLNRDQRSSSRLALRTQGDDYSATLKFSRIQPRVTVETVTNVRLTWFAIEETILLDFDIQAAGIRQLKFLLPASMKNARIRAQLVSETKIEPAAAADAGMVLVTLNLQDDVMDSYRVVVENDRPLADKNLSVPIAVSLVGETTNRYATLQNAGRDETEVAPSADFQPLNRQLNQFAKLKQKLGGGQLTMAYLAKQNVRQPKLTFGTKVRQTIDTVTASIEFSKTIMVVDSGGAYRAVQTFQVNNRSEQYLDIELPSRARLLTVWVEGAPVKPVKWTAAANDRRLRIPLVKTPAGDLDYPVQLKYAGQLGKLALLKQIEFPVVETLNVNVQLSQLQLRLPASHRWMNFDGTMTRVTSKGELEEGYLSYKGRQIQQLAEQIRSETSEFSSFSKFRALKNLSKLEQEMNEYQDHQLDSGINVGVQGAQNLNLQSQLMGNQEAIREVQRAAALDKETGLDNQRDNRVYFNDLLEQKKSRIARNSVTRQDKNWKGKSGYKVAQDEKQGQSEGKFDQAWLERNKLESKGQNEEVDQLIPLQSGREQGKQQIVVKPQTAQGPIDGEKILLLDDSISFDNPQDQSKRLLEADKANQRLPTPSDPRAAPAFGDVGVRFGSGGRGGSQGTENAGGGFGGGAGAGGLGNGPGGDGRSGGNLAPASRLASLRIELPERGVDYYFKSPRGKAMVTARPILQRSIVGWLTALAALVISMFSWITWRVTRRMGQSTVWRTVGFAAVTLFGLISVGTGTLPVFGLLGLATAFAIFVEYTTRLVSAPAAVSIRPQR